jgi:hypothetical protein
MKTIKEIAEEIIKMQNPVTKKEIEEYVEWRIKDELENILIEMPEPLTKDESGRYVQWKTKKELSEMTREELGQELMKMPGLESPEQEIFKRMHDINTFQCTTDNELYLGGTDEYGKDFIICFDAFDFINWIDTKQIAYIKDQVKKHVDSK